MANALDARFLMQMCICLTSSFPLYAGSVECLHPDPILPVVSFQLANIELKDDGGQNNFYGDFVLNNHEIEPGFFLQGRKVGDEFHVDYPRSQLEFKDLNGIWSPLHIDAPGSFLEPPDKVFIKKGGSVKIKAVIFSRSETGFSGSDFRVVVSVPNENFCFYSYPFRAYPERQPITDIKPVEGQQYIGVENLKSNKIKSEKK